MVVGEPLTATLCNCTTSPLKNSALFLHYISSGYLSVVNLISISNICRHQQAGGWKASSPTVRPHRGRVRYTPCLPISHKYVFQEIHKWVTEILQHTASFDPVFMESTTLSLMVDVAVQCGIPHLSSIVDKWGASACITRVHNLYQQCKLLINTNCSASAGSRTTYTFRTCSTAKPTNQTVARRGYVCTPS